MGKFKSDIQIARMAKMKPIKQVLSKLKVPDNSFAFSPQGRHINSGNTILPQGSPSGRHINSPLGKGSLRKSPLAGE